MTNKALSFEDLKRISVYSYSSRFNGEYFGFRSEPDEDGRRHSVLSDNTQYIANRMVSEIMKKDFKDNYRSVVRKFNGALDPDMDIYNINGLSEIHSEYRSLIKLMSPIFVSQMLQTNYSKETDFDSIPEKDKLAFNSWDMIKANDKYADKKNSEEYREMFAKIYCIAIDYSTDVESGSEGYISGSNLKAYKDSNSSQHWGKQLFDYYSSEETLIEIEEANINPKNITTEVNKIQNIFGVLRCLDFTDNQISRAQIDELEGQYFGLTLMSFAEGIKVGSINNDKSFRRNTLIQQQVFDELISSSNKSSTRSFWLDMQKKYGSDVIQQIVKKISTSYNERQLTGTEVQNEIKRDFPEFATSRSLVGTAALSQMLMFLGLGHLIYSSTESDDIKENIPEMISFGSAAYEGVKGVSYIVLTRRLRSYFVGKIGAHAQSGKPFAEVAKFYLNYVRGIKGVGKVEKKIVEAIFMRSRLVKIAERVGVVFGVLALGAAAYTLADAIMNGDVVGIIFEAVNTAIGLASATVSLVALAGVAWAGPVGIALAIIGGVVAVIQWLVERFLPKPVPPSPIEIFTRDVINKLGYNYNSDRYFFAYKKQNNTNYQQVFKFYEKELLFEEGNHDYITIPEPRVPIFSTGVICENGNNLYIYKYYNKQGEPYLSNIQLTKSPSKLYSNWKGQVSDDIRYFIDVAVVNNTSYGLAIQQLHLGADKRVYKWSTGRRAPGDNDIITTLNGNYGKDDELEALCKVGDRVFVLSRTRIYEIQGNALNQVCQYREERESRESRVDVKVSKGDGNIYIHTHFSYRDEKSSEIYEVDVQNGFEITELLGGRVDGEEMKSSFGVSVFSETRKNLIAIAGRYIERSGILFKADSKDKPSFLEVIGGLKYQDGDLAWNRATILSNVELKGDRIFKAEEELVLEEY